MLTATILAILSCPSSRGREANLQNKSGSTRRRTEIRRRNHRHHRHNKRKRTHEKLSLLIRSPSVTDRLHPSAKYERPVAPISRLARGPPMPATQMVDSRPTRRHKSTGVSSSRMPGCKNLLISPGPITATCACGAWNVDDRALNIGFSEADLLPAISAGRAATRQRTPAISRHG